MQQQPMAGTIDKGSSIKDSTKRGKGFGGLVVTFVAARMPRSEIQTPVRAEIWIDIYAPCAPLLHLWGHNIESESVPSLELT